MLLADIQPWPNRTKDLGQDRSSTDPAANFVPAHHPSGSSLSADRTGSSLSALSCRPGSAFTLHHNHRWSLGPAPDGPSQARPGPAPKGPGPDSTRRPTLTLTLAPSCATNLPLRRLGFNPASSGHRPVGAHLDAGQRPPALTVFPPAQPARQTWPMQVT